jgi:hypothetical protein
MMESIFSLPWHKPCGVSRKHNGINFGMAGRSRKSIKYKRNGTTGGSHPVDYPLKFGEIGINLTSTLNQWPEHHNRKER